MRAEIVRVAGVEGDRQESGWQLRIVASNGKVVLVSDTVYNRKASARKVLRSLERAALAGKLCVPVE